MPESVTPLIAAGVVIVLFIVLLSVLTSNYSLSGIVEKRILSAVLLIAARIDDGFGENLRIFFCFRPRCKVVRMLPSDVHVSVDERQQIASV